MNGGRIRELVLRESRRANVGHIGSSLSIADILAVLYGGVLRIEGPRDASRDRFILSKGHAALALYVVLYLRGWISDAQLTSYCGDGTLFGVHPEREVPGIDFSTGSLGHGLSYGAGAALAARRHGSRYRTYVLLSDAECNEGSTWEAVMFAGHHALANLVAIVDANGQQAFGYTRDVLDLAPLADKWRSFGWDVAECDGHDVEALRRSLETFDSASGKPHVLIARTMFGKGVGYMEEKIKWHYWPMSEDEYSAALRDIGVL